MRAVHRTGFTLIELMVVISIMALLLTLMLPAVQSSREAARRIQCASNLREIGQAFQLHHDAHGFYPTGGWGSDWIGDPDRGYDRRQPGGWVFNILPFVGEEPLHALGAQQSPQSPERMAANAARLSTPVPLFNCPSRRSAELFAADPQWGPTVQSPNYSNPVTSVARTDYASNGGDVDLQSKSGGGPASLADADGPDWAVVLQYMIDPPPRGRCTGITFPGSTVTAKSVTKGLSMTYLVGEKHCNSTHYEDGGFVGDNASMYTGSDDDITRVARYWSVPLPPMVDEPIDTYNITPEAQFNMSQFTFGSAHATTFNMVFCDGSVHSIIYEIDVTLHRHLSNRSTSQLVDLTKLEDPNYVEIDLYP